MIESGIVQKIRAALIPLGYDVDKIADQFVAGIPDLTVSRSKHTWFYEVKFFKSLPASGSDEIDFGVYLRMSPQVTNMISKFHKAYGASYLIFKDTRTLAEVSPIEVSISIKTRKRIPMAWRDFNEWTQSLPF